MAAPERLILFTRYPEPGSAKTRLISALGEGGAADLQRELAEHTLARVHQARSSRPFSFEVRYAGTDCRSMAAWLGADLALRLQCEGDLGARMHGAFDEAFSEGCARVVLIGTDCPGVSPFLFEQAFKALAIADVVLGPAADGGYYLVGLRKPEPRLFQDMPWGTERVLEATCERAKACGLSLCLLPPQTDIDRPQDLAVWEAARSAGSENVAERISVVIPALNEAHGIGQTLASALQGRNVETIVVDGGSGDGTIERANAQGATVIATAQGRATQMNAGAALATGSLLLFLHSDTRLPEGYDSCVREILADRAVAAGSFRLRIDGVGRGLRVIERVANRRSQWMALPYGDQALFLGADRFAKISGFAEIPQYFLDGHSYFPRSAQTLKIGERQAHAFPHLEFGKYIGIASAPLKTANFEPDLFMIYCDSAQLTQLIMAKQYTSTDETITARMSANAVCVYAILPVVQNGEYQVTVPCPGDRSRAMAQDDELVFTAPKEKLEDVVLGLRNSYDQGVGLGKSLTLMPEYELYEPYARIGEMLGIRKTR